MVRWPAAILFICCLTALLSAQASKDQASKEEKSAVPTAASPSAKTQFPMDAFPEFSAVMVGSVMNGDVREGYIYRSGNLVRAEGPEEHGYFIVDLTTLESFGVSAGGCIHDGNPFFRTAPITTVRPGYTVERAAAGQETMDGHSCKVEDVTLSSPRLAAPVKLRFWEADDLQGFPVKVEFRRANGHNPVIHYKNVVVGPQDPTLFIYPKDCQPSPKAPKPKAAPAAKKPAATAPAATPQH